MSVEFIIMQAEKKGIHPVCYLCRRDCKKPYSFWSFQMPPEIFCDKFSPTHTIEVAAQIAEIKHLLDKLTQLANKIANRANEIVKELEKIEEEDSFMGD